MFRRGAVMLAQQECRAQKEEVHIVYLFFLATVDKNDTVSFGFKWFHSKMKP